MVTLSSKLTRRRSCAGVALMEVMVASAVGAIVIGATLAGYNQASYRAEWGAFNCGAQSLAAERFEQTRGCRWDRDAATNGLVTANFPPQIMPLDLPVSGQPMFATNYTVIADVTLDPPLKMVRVDCVWKFPRSGKLQTNSIVSYRAPDN